MFLTFCGPDGTKNGASPPTSPHRMDTNRNVSQAIFSFSVFSLSVWIWSPSSDQVFDQSICLGQSATSIFRIIDRHREKNHFNRTCSCENTILKIKINFYKNGYFWGSKRKFRWRRGLDQGKFLLLNLEKLFLQLLMEHYFAKAHLQMKTFKAGPNDNINWIGTS